ncbi:MAG: hypothetical protein M3Y20_08805, partial [Actinomycetota bacterium]|nr:hypothetical protein [Actinomycetota bacterium]
MSIVDRIVYRFIHRNKHGEAGRAHDEVGGAHHAHAGHAHAGHGSVGQGHGADDDGPHEHGDLTEPGRFGGEHAERYAKRSRSWSRRRFYRRIARDVAQLAP